MPEILIVILAVIFVLGVAINIHEFGHFIVAKWFGMRIEAYSFFGLGPRIWGFKRGHTDYRISAIPLGAYVKLYGDDVTAPLEGGSSDEDRVPESELYELRPRWQKFLVMLGGPFMNIMLALAIPFFGALIYGVPSMPAPIVGVVNSGGAAENAGIKVGDRIIEMNGIENPTWEKIRDEALISPDTPVPMTVDRGGQKVSVVITPARTDMDGNSVGDVGMVPDVGVEPVEVGTLVPDSPAVAAGLQPGDRIIAFNGKTVRNSQELASQVNENRDAPVLLTIERDGQRQEIQTAAQLSETGSYLIGIRFAAANITTRVPVGLGGAASFAVDTNLRILRLTGRVFGQLFSGERSVKDAGLAGPVGIIQIISKVVTELGFAGLFSILAVISLNLGIFNLLPIPLLDGGQIMMLGIEKVMSWFGKTLSIAFREKIQMAGLAVILLLMVFTLFLDISRFF
ncbi:MAG TPA: RIP metalloprotease RseP [Pyrinomonadaceae bacterium]|nr:RIP metalloprotease RseP [Pyrinomonadaceae bacterium]